MRGSKTQVTPKQHEFLGLLLSGVSQNRASKEVGIDISTGKRWMRMSHVLDAYAKMQNSVETSVYEQVEALAGKAIKAIEDSLLPAENTSNRIKAAQMVLDRVLPMQGGQTVNVVNGAAGQTNQLIDPSLLQYMVEDEIDQIERIIHSAMQRKEMAEKERMRLPE